MARNSDTLCDGSSYLRFSPEEYRRDEENVTEEEARNARMGLRSTPIVERSISRTTRSSIDRSVVFILVDIFSPRQRAGLVFSNF